VSLIYDAIDGAFQVFMWMLIEPDGRKFFCLIDALFIVLGIYFLFLTRDRNKDKS